MSRGEKIKPLVRSVFFQHISTADSFSSAFLKCIDQECLVAGARNPTLRSLSQKGELFAHLPGNGIHI